MTLTWRSAFPTADSSVGPASAGLRGVSWRIVSYHYLWLRSCDVLRGAGPPASLFIDVELDGIDTHCVHHN